MKHLDKINKLSEFLSIEGFDLDVSYDFTRGDLSKPIAEIIVSWSFEAPGHDAMLKELIKAVEMYDAEVEHVL